MMHKERLYSLAFSTFGAPLQIQVTIEECAELIKALSKYNRFKTPAEIHAVCEEIADLQIMLEQMQLNFGPALVEKIKLEKLERLQNLVTKTP